MRPNVKIWHKCQNILFKALLSEFENFYQFPYPPVHDDIVTMRYLFCQALKPIFMHLEATILDKVTNYCVAWWVCKMVLWFLRCTNAIVSLGLLITQTCDNSPGAPNYGKNKKDNNFKNAATSPFFKTIWYAFRW